MKPAEKSGENRGCIFCGGGPKSDEHLFGKWLGRQVTIPENPTHIQFQENSRSGFKEEKRGATQSISIRSVCIPCNNGWMSTIEDAAQHLLLRLMRGEPEDLDRHQQLTISMWVVLKTMIWESQKHILEHIPQTDRDFLFQHRVRAGWQIPPNWLVWCGKTDIEFGECGAIGSARLVVRENPDGTIWPYPVNTSSLTMSFSLFCGSFVAFAFRSPFVEIASIDLVADTFRRIHPFEANTSWPPLKILPSAAVPVIVRGLVDDVRDMFGP